MRSRVKAKPRATTKDVVPAWTTRGRVPPKWREHHDRLVALRQDLEERQQVLATDAAADLSFTATHIADAGTDSYDRDWALGVLSSEQNSIYQIDQALDRIRNGSYGICELTGKPIDPSRLEAIPWTRFSLEAERRLEDQGNRKRARLGARASITESAPGETADEDEA